MLVHKKKFSLILQVIKRITRSAIIVEINTKDVKLVKAHILFYILKGIYIMSFVSWNLKTKY